MTFLSRSDGWAVGNSFTSSGVSRTLILHWNGTTWTRVASPNPGAFHHLEAVTALSPRDAWAVGDYVPPNSPSDKTLILHWNGIRWAKVASPTPAGVRGGSLGLLGVSAHSPNDVWAVGYYQSSTSEGTTLVLHWNG